MHKFPQLNDLIIGEDEDLAFINKPAFLSSLDERDLNAPSLLRMIRKHHPGWQLCHRLDKETSGIMVVAKNPEAYRGMAMSFEARQVTKTYHAVIDGVLNVEKRSISLPLSATKKGTAKVDMKEGKPAETIFTTLRLFNHFTLLECVPVTGRLHQIRVHLSSQNFPITGDILYGGKWPMLSHFKRNFKTAQMEDEQPMIRRLALHAHALRFTFDGRNYEVKAPYPKDFEVLLKLLEKFEA